MVSINIRNITGQELDEQVELDDGLYNYKYCPHAVKETVRYIRACWRSGNHKVKTRGEVRGSTRKLYRQKGTGNARAGSLRSPLRRHGGVVFGPVVRSHNFKLNKKIRKSAMRSVISKGLNDKTFMVVDMINLPDNKTKSLMALIKTHKIKSCLFIEQSIKENFYLACRNIQSVDYITIESLNVYNLLLYRNVICSVSAFKDIEAKLLL